MSNRASEESVGAAAATGGTRSTSSVSKESSSRAQYKKYFDEFLPGIVGELMLENLKGLNCAVEIVVTDSDHDPWRIVVAQGRLSQVSHERGESQCRYLLDTETLVEVIAAKVSPQDAFFETRIEIEGDMERGLELSTVLEAFFERFPFNA